MRILGLDPGIATIGFGLIEAERWNARMLSYGAITTPAGLPLSRRLYQISRDADSARQFFAEASGSAMQPMTERQP